MCEKIISQIMTIRATGITNMLDVIFVQHYAYEQGMIELALYLNENKKDYWNFIMYGKRPA